MNGTRPRERHELASLENVARPMSEKAPNKAPRFTGYEGRRPGDYSHSMPSKPWQFPATLLASSPHCGFIH